jgi:hypothetical protein
LISSISELLNKQSSVDQNLISLLAIVMKSIADSCYHSLQARSLNQFQNNLKFLNNLLINEMLSPFLHQGTELWIQLSFICMMINEMLLYLKNIFLSSPANGIIKDEVSKMHEENKMNAFEEKKETSEYPKLDDTLTKDYWFKVKKDIDIGTMANILAYTVNTLFIEEKWNVMICLIRNFSNITLHYFSNNLLPFLIHAQNIKLSQAKTKTDAKKEELEKRIDEFKKWEVRKK